MEVRTQLRARAAERLAPRAHLGQLGGVDGAAAADVSAAYEATSARIDAINTAVDSLLARGGPLDPSGPCRERAGLAGTGRR